MHALDGYLTGQSDWLVNYAERHRAGLRVSTAITEGTANFLVNRRMNKSQHVPQMEQTAQLCMLPTGSAKDLLDVKSLPAELGN